MAVKYEKLFDILRKQVRFRSISSTSIQATNTQEERLLAYIKEIESSR